jgi:hypothetical protein
VKAYEGFITGTATVAGALVGLLFVAVSVIGLEGGGPLDLLARRLGAREPLNPQPGEQDPEPGPPGI